MATKTTVRGDSINIQAQMDQSLKEAGIENRAALDKLMATTSVEKLLSDKVAVHNYFKLANVGLYALIEPKDLREVRGATPTPDNYREYFDNQIVQPTPFFNFIPVQDLFNPQALGQKAGFKPEQVEAYSMILQGSSGGSTQAASWTDYDTQGGSSGGASGGGSYGGGSGKAMSTGGGNYSGGTGKAMSTGGSPQTKSLGAPPPPPGMGGGGYAPPPPPGGSGGGYGSDPLQGFDPTRGTQEARGYVDANFQGDPEYGWFQMLFGRQDFVTGVYAEGAAQLDQIHRARDEITNQLANADPKQVMLLNAKMEDISSTEREVTDKMERAQHYQDELVNCIKTIFDTQAHTQDNFAKNMHT